MRPAVTVVALVIFEYGHFTPIEVVCSSFPRKFRRELKPGKWVFQVKVGGSSDG